MFYFGAHLKDLSVTLIRAAVNARQFSVNLKAPAYPDNDLLGRKAAIFVVATFCWTSPADVS